MVQGEQCRAMNEFVNGSSIADVELDFCEYTVDTRFAVYKNAPIDEIDVLVTGRLV